MEGKIQGKQPVVGDMITIYGQVVEYEKTNDIKIELCAME